MELQELQKQEMPPDTLPGGDKTKTRCNTLAGEHGHTEVDGITLASPQQHGTPVSVATLIIKALVTQEVTQHNKEQLSALTINVPQAMHRSKEERKLYVCNVYSPPRAYTEDLKPVFGETKCTSSTHRHCDAALKLGAMSARSAVPAVHEGLAVNEGLGVHEGPAVDEALLELVCGLGEELEAMLMSPCESHNLPPAIPSSGEPPCPGRGDSRSRGRQSRCRSNRLTLARRQRLALARALVRVHLCSSTYCAGWSTP